LNTSSIAELEQIASGASGDLGVSLVNYISAIKEKKYIDAARIIRSTWKIGMNMVIYKRIMAASNEILFQNSLELTTHGIQKSFRFWTNEEKNEYLGVAVSVARAIHNELTRNVCIGYGSCLALARSEDLIPHDDDVDLIMALPRSSYDNFKGAADAALKVLREHGFITAPVKSAPGLIHIRKGKFKVDLFSGIEEEGYFTTFPGPRKKILMDDLFPAVDRKLIDVMMPTPCKMDAYLEKVYGKGWRVPDPNFSHSWALPGEFGDLIVGWDA
jgi:hypothetical protein